MCSTTQADSCEFKTALPRYSSKICGWKIERVFCKVIGLIENFKRLIDV